jgi:hypothetical protein
MDTTACYCKCIMYIPATLFHFIKWWRFQFSRGNTVYTAVECPQPRSTICNVYVSHLHFRQWAWSQGPNSSCYFRTMYDVRVVPKADDVFVKYKTSGAGKSSYKSCSFVIFLSLLRGNHFVIQLQQQKNSDASNKNIVNVDTSSLKVVVSTRLFRAKDQVGPGPYQLHPQMQISDA